MIQIEARYNITSEKTEKIIYVYDVDKESKEGIEVARLYMDPTINVEDHVENIVKLLNSVQK